MTNSVLERKRAGQAAEQSGGIYTPGSRRSPGTSPFVVALIVFLLLNMGLSIAQPIPIDKLDFPYRGWAWWTIQDLKNDTEKHNVAFLGSSLTVDALSTADATVYNQSIDATAYHKVRYLDQVLKEKFGGKFSTFNLSAPGQMPSDAYLTARAMTKLTDRPDVIIYGVAPRDFIDSSLNSPADTEPYQFLSRLISPDGTESMIYQKPLEKVNYYLAKSVYLYSNAIDMQMKGNAAAESALDRLLPRPSGKRFTYWDRKKLLPEYKKGEFHPGACMRAPQDLSKPSEYRDNSHEYIYRYKKPNKVAFETQMFFLGRLADWCREEGITLVVINMPVTKDNLRLLASKHYDDYMAGLTGFASRHGATFFDMNDHQLFLKEDFGDGVHMNARGGIKLVNHLSDLLAAEPRTRRALQQCARRVADSATGNHKPLL